MSNQLTDEEIARREQAVDAALAMLNGVTREVWVRTIVFFLCLLNSVAVMCGGDEIVGDVNTFAGAAYPFVSAILVLVSGIWAWWRNNSFTDIARTADAIKMLMDNGLSLYQAYQGIKGVYAENEKAKKESASAKRGGE